LENELIFWNLGVVFAGLPPEFWWTLGNELIFGNLDVVSAGLPLDFCRTLSMLEFCWTLGKYIRGIYIPEIHWTCTGQLLDCH
jgi:hypothetical protein